MSASDHPGPVQSRAGTADSVIVVVAEANCDWPEACRAPVCSFPQPSGRHDA
jgi:hypothetical protein